MKKEVSANEILEKLKWYHGEDFSFDLLQEEFRKILEQEKSKKGSN